MFVYLDQRWRTWLPADAVPPPAAQDLNVDTPWLSFQMTLKQAEQHPPQDSAVLANLFIDLVNSRRSKPPFTRDADAVVDLVQGVAEKAKDSQPIWSALASGCLELAERYEKAGDHQNDRKYAGKMLAVLREHPGLQDATRSNNGAPEPERLVRLLNDVGLANEAAPLIKTCNATDNRALVLVVIENAGQEGQFDQIRKMIKDNLPQDDPDAVACECAMRGQPVLSPKQVTYYGSRAVGGIEHSCIVQGKFDVVETINSAWHDDSVTDLSLSGLAQDAGVAREHGHLTEAVRALRKGWARYVPSRESDATSLALFAEAAMNAGDFDLAEKVVREKTAYPREKMIDACADLARSLHAAKRAQDARRVMSLAEEICNDLDFSDVSVHGTDIMRVPREYHYALDDSDAEHAMRLILLRASKAGPNYSTGWFSIAADECLRLHRADWLNHNSSLFSNPADQAVFDAAVAHEVEYGPPVDPFK